MANEPAGVVDPLTSSMTTAITRQIARIATSMGVGSRQINLGQVLANIQQAPYVVESPTGANGTETVVSVVPFTINALLTRATLTANAALATNGTNYVTINVQKRTAGGAPVVLATYSQATTALVAWTPLALALPVTALAAGDALTVAVVATGTGTLAGGVVVVTLEYTAL